MGQKKPAKPPPPPSSTGGGGGSSNPFTSSPCYSLTAADCVASMSVDELIGQMTQAAKNYIYSKSDIATYHIGSVLSGGGGGPNGAGGTASEWYTMTKTYQDAATTMPKKIPILYGVDAVHGHNNVYGATIFPHNIGLGAANDADLVQRIADVTRKEVLATGIHWTFGPCVAVPRDDRWGRTYEGFSENPNIVKTLGKQAIIGFQGGSTGLSSVNGGVLATAKHFLADGGTLWGTGSSGYQIDQGDCRETDTTIRNIHLPPYVDAVNANVASVMVSFSSISGKKLHGFKAWVTDVLRGELGFKGFVVSDWAGVDQIYPNDYPRSVREAINAGVDMVMVPDTYKNFISTLKNEYNAGNVTLARLKEAATRIIQAKKDADLWNKPYGDSSLQSKVGSTEHRAIAREAVAKSMVLLQKTATQRNGTALTFPLPRASTDSYRILVAGAHADNIGLQCGGWTISWQGAADRTSPMTVGTTILAGIKNAVSNTKITVDYVANGKTAGGYTADYGIVVIGEQPYAEGQGDSSTLALADAAVISSVCDGTKITKACIVVLISGRPLIITDYLSKAQVWIAGWLPGTEGAGVADVLFQNGMPLTGTLPVTWPKFVSQEPINAGSTNANDALFPLGFKAT